MLCTLSSIYYCQYMFSIGFGWEGLGARGEGDDKGWDGWMASLTRWTWVSVNSRSWWWTGRPGVLRFMGSQRADTTEQLIWSDLIWFGGFIYISILTNDFDHFYMCYVPFIHLLKWNVRLSHFLFGLFAFLAFSSYILYPNLYRCN